MKHTNWYWPVSLLVMVATLCACTLLVFFRMPPRALFADAPAATQPPVASETARLTAAPTLPPMTEPLPSQTAAPTQPAPTVSTVKLMAVGDNLIHNMVYNSGMGTNPWNYDHLYAHIQADLDWADVSVINQETIFVSNHANISNYPLFGTPQEVGDAVYKAGFNVILQATNHTMDKGIDNVYDAIDFWSDKDVTVLGIHNSRADAQTPKIITVNGVKLGLLNYTYGLNGFTLPNGQEYAIDLLTDESKLLSDIAYCEENADVTIGFWHMGVEYMTVPTEDAKRVVEKTVAAGCDLLICAHPHVLQPYEMYTASNGNQALVYYSLGNFISAQDRLDSLLGGMAKVTLQLTDTGTERKVEILAYSLEPLVTHVNYGTSFTTYHLEDYSDRLGAYNVLCPVTTSALWNRFHEITGAPIPAE